MDFTKPILHKSLAGFFIRVPMGLYFIISGRLLMNDVQGFAEGVKSFGLVSDQIATVYAVVLPYMEFGVGILLLVGFWTSLSAILSSLMLLSFIYAYGIYPNEITPFNKDIIWLGASFALLSIGAGAFSIDSFRNKGD